MMAAPAAAESRTTAAGPMPILSDAAPPLLMVEGVAVPDVPDVVAGVVPVGETVDAVPELMDIDIDMDMDVDMDVVDDIDVEEVVAAVTAKSPLVAYMSLMLLLLVASRV